MPGASGCVEGGHDWGPAGAASGMVAAGSWVYIAAGIGVFSYTEGAQDRDVGRATIGIRRQRVDHSDQIFGDRASADGCGVRLVWYGHWLILVGGLLRRLSAADWPFYAPPAFAYMPGWSASGALGARPWPNPEIALERRG
jgi:hypothetical protein